MESDITELLELVVVSIDDMLTETSGREIVSASGIADKLLDLRLTVNQIQQVRAQQCATVLLP